MMTQTPRTFTRTGPPPASTPEQLMELQARLTGGKAPPQPPGASIADSLPEDNNPILTAALAALQAGLSVVPPMPGQKRPIGSWKQYQQATASESEIREWYGTGNSGLGLVTGAISGGLEALDFDSKQAWQDYKAAAQATGLGELLAKIARGYAEETPHGFHLLYRCDEITGNTKLATDGSKTLIETRGEGGFIIVAPSTINGNSYTLKAGGFDQIVTISPQERELLHRLARSFDQSRKTSPSRNFQGQTQQASSDRIGDMFNERTTWPEILQPHGWTPVYQAGETTHWRRPGKSEGTSATTNHAGSELLWVFSANAHPLEPERSYDRFGCWAMLEHNGDFKAAAKAAAARLGIKHQPGTAATGGQQPQQGPIFTEIEPLPDDQPQVAHFDKAMLPDAFAPWITDIADRMQCPPDFPAVAAVVGRQVGIRPKQHDDWLVVPNLWGAIIGRPSLLKTPALQEPMKPLQTLEAAAKDIYETESRDHAADLLVSEEKGKAARKLIAEAIKEGRDPRMAAQQAVEDADLPPPVRQRYITNDTTVEKLGEHLAANPRGILVFRDELTGFLKSLDREGREGSRAFFLEDWNGTGRFTFDRIGRGTVEIEAATVSILGGIQPGPLQEYLAATHRGGAGDDGLMQRFQLLVWPDAPGQWINIDRNPDLQARQLAAEVCR